MFDAIVIGGGPAGATAASVLAMDERRVLLLEREHFPRYHVGESLLPGTVHGVCDLIGVGGEIREAGFVKKRGGTFRWGDNPNLWTFAFGDLLAAPDADFAYQVERSRFDHILLRRAAALGVDVREGCRVTETLGTSRLEGVRYVDESGESHEVRARYVVDASGGRGVLSDRVGNRVYDRFFRNMSLFGYFEGGARLDEPNAGNVLTVAFEGGWFWYIPLRDNLTSVGAVVPTGEIPQLKGGDRHQALAAMIETCPLIAEMLKDARPVQEGPYAEARLLRDYSYTNERFFQDGGVLIGDAACFIDPVFSSGVHLATLAGLLAARSINTCLADELPEDVAFREFERRYRREYGAFYQFLLGFYEIHRESTSPFWRTRKIEHAARDDHGAFVRLVAGLDSAEARFRSPEAFIESTVDESRVLEAATMIDDSWSKRDPALASEAAKHIAVLGRERVELLTGTGQAFFEDGLVPSESSLRWRLPD